MYCNRMERYFLENLMRWLERWLWSQGAHMEISRRWDSNSWPALYERAALPLCYVGMVLTMCSIARDKLICQYEWEWLGPYGANIVNRFTMLGKFYLLRRSHLFRAKSRKRPRTFRTSKYISERCFTNKKIFWYISPCMERQATEDGLCNSSSVL